jgi:hypothetical protein
MPRQDLRRSGFSGADIARERYEYIVSAQSFITPLFRCFVAGFWAVWQWGIGPIFGGFGVWAI